jgi:hypothetical protein
MQLNERPISGIFDEAENGRPTADYKHAKEARSRQDPAEQIRQLCVTGSSSAFPPKTPISGGYFACTPSSVEPSPDGERRDQQVPGGRRSGRISTAPPVAAKALPLSGTYHLGAGHGTRRCLLQSCLARLSKIVGLRHTGSYGEGTAP